MESRGSCCLFLDGRFGGFDHDEHFVTFLQFHFLDGASCYDRRQRASGGVDDYFRNDRASHDLLHGSRQLIADAELFHKSEILQFYDGAIGREGKSIR